jgi:hypothetical protein
MRAAQHLSGKVHSSQLFLKKNTLEQVLDRMDADDVMDRNSRPVVPPFNYGVTPGPWVCLNSDSLCGPILACMSPHSFPALHC